MPRLIKDGVVIEDNWLPANEELPCPAEGQIATLEQWLLQADKSETAVQLEPGDTPTPLLEHLQDISLIAINFPVFTDGRGFSYGRALRERGFSGELRAVGHFIRDQVAYLQRCGFSAFQMSDESMLESTLDSLADFSEYYQAAPDQPLPLFRRRT